MQSKHFRQGGITDSWEQGTQRPKGEIAFGGDNGESNPRVTTRRGDGTMRFGAQTGPSQLRFGTIRQDVLQESWRDRALEVEDYVEQDSLGAFSEMSFRERDQQGDERGTRQREPSPDFREGFIAHESKISRQHFYAVARGREEGVFLSWEETEPLVKGFRGAVHHRFDSLGEAEAFLEDNDLRRIPEPSISADEAERVREINSQRKARMPDSAGDSSYRGSRMVPADLASMVSRSDCVHVHQGGSGVEGMAEGVAYQEVEAMHRDEQGHRKDSGRTGVREESWRGGEDQGEPWDTHEQAVELQLLEQTVGSATIRVTTTGARCPTQVTR
jgi:hypothetical protein